MKFLVDNQLPLALRRFIASHDVDCEHVLDIGLAKASDLAIWEYARRTGWVVVSKDEDFFYLASRPEAEGQ